MHISRLINFFWIQFLYLVARTVLPLLFRSCLASRSTHSLLLVRSFPVISRSFIDATGDLVFPCSESPLLVSVAPALCQPAEKGLGSVVWLDVEQR